MSDSDFTAFKASFFPRGVGRLRCPVQRYAWGHRATNSLVARLAGLPPSTEPCAELWMGAHPSASSLLLAASPDEPQTIPLNEAIARYPEAFLGGNVVQAWGPALPFLFKVLSVATPLSIQAHPDADLARLLHARDPAHYPDASHKPEIGVALGRVELLAGFRPSGELAALCTAYPELESLLVPRGRIEGLTPEKVFRSLYDSSDAVFVAAMNSLARRLEDRERSQRSVQEKYFLEALTEYGSADRGLGCFFILNFVTLDAGDAISIGPRYPHAYLSGDIVECMANSDNVVRAGLTRKFQDRATLLDMLDYGATQPTILRASDQCGEPNRLSYFPAEEFFIERYTGEGAHFAHSAVRSAHIVACLEGGAAIETAWGSETLSFGQVLLVPAFSGEWRLKIERGTCFVAGTPVDGEWSGHITDS